MHRLLSIVLFAAIIVAGCGDSGTRRSDDPWDQNWFLGSMQTPEGAVEDVRTPKPVGIWFRPGFGGSDGCDLFGGAYEYTEPVLSFPTIEYTYADSNPVPAECPDQYLPIVEAVRGAVADGVEVTELSADMMVWWWEQGDVVFEFRPGVEG
ncbi:MAG: hypothetical protein QNL12_15055 [Acidimicrobiia bacterium]|nr:hypothetical protein [Acidimicrobiia bacterium]